MYMALIDPFRRFIVYPAVLRRVRRAWEERYPQGVLYAFRSYLYGPGLDVASSVERASAGVLAPDESSIFATGEVRSNLAGTVWETRLEMVDVRPSRHPKIEIYRLRTALGAAADTER
jgi:hypothetical protein